MHIYFEIKNGLRPPHAGLARQTRWVYSLGGVGTYVKEMFPLLKATALLLSCFCSFFAAGEWALYDIHRKSISGFGAIKHAKTPQNCPGGEIRLSDMACWPNACAQLGGQARNTNPSIADGPRGISRFSHSTPRPWRLLRQKPPWYTSPPRVTRMPKRRSPAHQYPCGGRDRVGG